MKRILGIVGLTVLALPATAQTFPPCPPGMTEYISQDVMLLDNQAVTLYVQVCSADGPGSGGQAQLAGYETCESSINSSYYRCLALGASASQCTSEFQVNMSGCALTFYGCVLTIGPDRRYIGTPAGCDQQLPGGGPPQGPLPPGWAPPNPCTPSCRSGAIGVIQVYTQ
jgi:hypothetical protein